MTLRLGGLTGEHRTVSGLGALIVIQRGVWGWL